MGFFWNNIQDSELKRVDVEVGNKVSQIGNTHLGFHNSFYLKHDRPTPKYIADARKLQDASKSELKQLILAIAKRLESK